MRPVNLIRAAAGMAAAVCLASSAGAATLPSGFSEQTFSGITNPTALAFAPDGRVFVSQQCGALRVIKNGAVLSTPFATIGVSCTDERGLHSIAFDPNYATNRYVYVRYTRSGTVNNVIGRLQASSTNPDVATSSTPTVLFTVPFNNNRYHHGGGLVVGNDGKLYSSFGDHQSGGNAELLSSLWGKVVRINTDGTIPTDNPFYATTSGNNRAIWAYGFRNPFTMAIQPGTGRIHVNDVGNSASTGREEVNNLTRGGNYGWDNNEGTGSYYSYAASSQGGNAIVGGTFYNPQTVMFPSTYVGRYFFGDYGGGWIRSIMGSGSPGSLTGFASGISGPTDVETHPDGSVWYTARNSSNVRRITYGNPPRVTPTPTPTATPSNNTPPSPVINTPATGTLYQGGSVIGFSGSCTDAQDGTVPASRFAWEIVFHHNTHTHPGSQFSGVSSGNFETPADGEWDPNQWWRVNFTCTDAAGASVTVSRDVQPRTVGLTVASSPSGAQVAADGVAGAAPVSTTAVVAMKRVLNTNGPQSIGGVTHYFEQWSDGGEKQHDIFMPSTATTYTATFRPGSAYTEITPGAGSVTANTNDGNLPGNAVDGSLASRWSGNGDGAWLRLDLGTTRSIGHATIAFYNGNMRRTRFDLQVSGDGASWTTVFSGESSGTTLNEEAFDFRDVSARYFRYLGHGNTVNLFSSITEISLFGTGGTTVTPTPTPTPIGPTPTPTSTPMGPTPTPTATPGGGTPVEITPGAAAITASANDGNLPANTIDGSLATRWSANGDPQWLQFDLGSQRTVSSVKVAFYNGNIRQSRFDLQCSTGGGVWSNLRTGVLSSGTTTALETFDFTDATCQWVRYLGHGNTVNLWNSLTEVEVWGF